MLGNTIQTAAVTWCPLAHPTSPAPIKPHLDDMVCQLNAFSIEDIVLILIPAPTAAHRGAVVVLH